MCHKVFAFGTVENFWEILFEQPPLIQPFLDKVCSMASVILTAYGLCFGTIITIFPEDLSMDNGDGNNLDDFNFVGRSIPADGYSCYSMKIDFDCSFLLYILWVTRTLDNLPV